MCLLLLRGLVKKVDKFEDIEFGDTWFLLCDYGIQFELEFEYLKSFTTAAAGLDGKIRAKALDMLQRHIDPAIKSDFDELVDKYKKQFEESGGKDQTIVIRTQGNQTIMGQKRAGSGFIPKR